MKKLITLALVSLVTLSLAGCCCIPVNKCDLCGEVGMHPNRSTSFSDSKHPVCDDCYRRYGMLFR